MGRTGMQRPLMRPVVTEIPRTLEAVTRDPFIDGLDGASPGAIVVDLDAARPREVGPDGPAGQEAA